MKTHVHRVQLISKDHEIRVGDWILFESGNDLDCLPVRHILEDGTLMWEAPSGGHERRTKRDKVVGICRKEGFWYAPKRALKHYIKNGDHSKPLEFGQHLWKMKIFVDAIRK